MSLGLPSSSGLSFSSAVPGRPRQTGPGGAHSLWFAGRVWEVPNGSRIGSSVGSLTHWRPTTWKISSDGEKADFGRPITYPAFVDNLQSILHLAVSTCASDEARSDLLDVISKVTAHSMRCTITSAMAHHSFEHQSIQIQGQWKDSSMVEKFSRDRDVLKLLVADVKADIISGEQVTDSEDDGDGEENELSNPVPEGVDPFASGDRRDQPRSEADVRGRGTTGE